MRSREGVNNAGAVSPAFEAKRYDQVMCGVAVVVKLLQDAALYHTNSKAAGPFRRCLEIL